MRSAPAFQVTILPSSVFVRMASSEESTAAARRAFAAALTRTSASAAASRSRRRRFSVISATEPARLVRYGRYGFRDGSSSTSRTKSP